jgi:hypothetical protein
MKRQPIIPPSLREVEQSAESFQRMLDAARERRFTTPLIEHTPKGTPMPKYGPPDGEGTAYEDDEPIIDESHLVDEDVKEPPSSPTQQPPTPAETAGAAISTIEQGAVKMAEEAKAAAAAIETIPKMIRSDADEFSVEITKISGRYCARVADYLKQCSDIQLSFQQKKEAMIKSAQALGPVKD